jgi:hypothetical protein
VDVCFCGIPLSVSQRERCPSSGCPAYGKQAGTPEWERAIRSAVTRPYSRRSGNTTGAEALALLDERYADPAEIREMSQKRTRARMLADPVHEDDDALAPMMDRYLRTLGVRCVGHEPRWA